MAIEHIPREDTGPAVGVTGSLIPHPTEAEKASERLTSLRFLLSGHPSFPVQAAYNSALELQVTVLSCSVLCGLSGLRQPDVAQAVGGLGWWGGKKRAWRGFFAEAACEEEDEGAGKRLYQGKEGCGSVLSRAAWVVGVCARTGVQLRLHTMLALFCLRARELSPRSTLTD
jgi:hypothetical protein